MKVAATAAGTLLCLAFLGLSAMAGAAEEGTVYLWVDKNGTPHYEDRPPDTEPSKEMNLRYKLTDANAVAAATQSKAQTSEAAKTREQQQAEEKTAEQQDRDKVMNEREQGCNDAKARLQKYDTAHRLYRPGPDGQRIYLSDEETDAARADARKAVDEWCGE
jgi:hypothetical protein